MTEAEYRVGFAASSPAPKIVYVSPPFPILPNTRWAQEGREGKNPLWNSPSGRHQIGRAGALTPAQIHRGHHGERESAAERAGRM
ncbi:hypothetical protein [Plantactinospora sp. DSM 117369]